MLDVVRLCSGMLRHRMQCYGMLCYGMLCYGMLVCYGMLWYAKVCYGMLWYAMVCYGMLWYAMPCCIGAKYLAVIFLIAESKALVGIFLNIKSKHIFTRPIFCYTRLFFGGLQVLPTVTDSMLASNGRHIRD